MDDIFYKNPTPNIIPKTLEDAIENLKQGLDPDFQIHVKEKIKDLSSYHHGFGTYYHHGFGTYIRNTWCLWSRGRLTLWFNERGIYHADDMSGIIFDSYDRDVRGEDINLEGQIAFYSSDCCTKCDSKNN